jgi:FSR family fosmidomycin resistance protein-like MFS transporter
MSFRKSRGPLAIAAMVAVLHGVNDAYTAFIHPLLPRLMEKLDLSIALAATLTMTLSLSASIAQPILGHVADRGGQRMLVILGPLATAVFLSAMGLVPGFWSLLLLLALGGLGSAAFHPPAAAMAVRSGGGKKSGIRHAVFSFGGSVGYAAGPLIAVAIVHQAGLEGLWMAVVPMLVVAVVAHAILPPRAPRMEHAPTPTPARIARLLGGPIGILFVISALGAFLQRLVLTLVPIVVARGGGSETEGAIALTAYLGGQAVGVLAGGLLADRVDRRHLLAGLMVLSLPTHLLAFLEPIGTTGFAIAAVAGVVNGAALPAIVVMAVEMEPRSSGLAAGIVMGLSWAAGSVAVLGAGFLGDAIGPRAAALVTIPVILIGAALALHPRLRPHGRPALAAEDLAAPIV